MQERNTKSDFMLPNKVHVSLKKAHPARWVYAALMSKRKGNLVPWTRTLAVELAIALGTTASTVRKGRDTLIESGWLTWSENKEDLIFLDEEGCPVDPGTWKAIFLPREVAEFEPQWLSFEDKTLFAVALGLKVCFAKIQTLVEMADVGRATVFRFLQKMRNYESIGFTSGAKKHDVNLFVLERDPKKWGLLGGKPPEPPKTKPTKQKKESTAKSPPAKASEVRPKTIETCTQISNFEWAPPEEHFSRRAA